MPKSSRHKSHKHSKHGSKDARDYSESEEDAKNRDFNKEESSVRVSKNLGSSDKRKDHPGNINGAIADEYVSSKRRKDKDKEKEKEKEKEKSDFSAVSDRWSGGGVSDVAVERETKGESSRIDGERPSKSKSGVDSKSKSSRAHEGGGEKREESKSESKVEHKRKYEKEYGRKEIQLGKDYKEVKEKAKVFEKEKERKVKVIEEEVEDELVDIGDALIPLVDFGKEQEGRHGRENNVLPIQDERNHESEKDLEKYRRKRDGSNEKDKYHDDIKGSGDKRVSSREDREKDEKYKIEKYKEESHGDKHREDARYKDEKYAEDVYRERKYKDVKYRESSEKINRHKDDKYREDIDRDKRPRDDKYRESGDRDNKYRDAKYHEDKYRDAKYHEDKYRDADKDYRRRGDKYHEDGDRDDRHREDLYFEDSRNKDDKKQRDDSVKDKRVRDVKYQEERLVRDEKNDNYDPKQLKDESEAVEFRHKRSNYRDTSPNFDDRGTKYRDDRGKRRPSEKEEYDDVRNRSIKDQNYEMERKYSNSGRIESIGNRGRSSLRDADIVMSPNQGRCGNSPSYRVIKQEDSRYREYMHGGRERREPRDLTPAKEYAGNSGLIEKSSRSNENYTQKDDAFTERQIKENALNSPFRRVDKSPSSANNDRRSLNRYDVRRSLDVEGSKEIIQIKDYRENRGNRDLPIEKNLPEDEIPEADTDNINISNSSPYGKPNYFNNSNRSLPPPTPFRGGPDRLFDDENRNKQNRRRRIDQNMGRPQPLGNASWRGNLPNWPSPVANGFVPFQHGPPTLGFHPVRPPFPNNPMFGVRPQFPNNSIFGDESHLFGRLDWDHNNRNFNSVRGWETSRGVWKGQNTGLNAEAINMRNNNDISAQGMGDEEPFQNDKRQTSVQVDNSIDYSSDVLESDFPEEATIAIPEDISDLKKEDDDYLSRAYFSMLDISEDLSQDELYSQYTTLVGINRNADPEEDDSRLVIMEDDIDALGKDSNRTSSTSLFCTMNDSIFQRAMSLYKKLNEEVMTMGQDNVPSNDEQQMEVIPAVDKKEPEIVVPELTKVKIEPNIDQVIGDCGERSDETGADLNTVKMEIDPVVIKQEREDDFVEDGSSSAKEVNLGNEGPNLNENKMVVLPFSGASAEVEVEVNLSRIHQSPESTH